MAVAQPKSTNEETILSEVVLRESHGVTEFPVLVAIWRSAVVATHDFLSAGDLAEIERELPAAYLPSVHLTVAELDGRPVGFSGIDGERLEMLFVDDAFRGRGIGTKLLEHAVHAHGVTELDVNEQNPGALAFYQSKGFEVIGRSELDPAGRPYPLLHMRRIENAQQVSGTGQQAHE
jgi:putative acetyltransferase